jgi:hypothetical protein
LFPNISIIDNKYATANKNILKKIKTKYTNNRRKDNINKETLRAEALNYDNLLQHNNLSTINRKLSNKEN